MKFSVCQSPSKTKVMLPVSRTDRQSADSLWLQLQLQCWFHSFFMQLALANKTNLHFNMRYVNLEFKINRQGKPPALLLPLFLSSVGQQVVGAVSQCCHSAMRAVLAACFYAQNQGRQRTKNRQQHDVALGHINLNYPAK